MVYKALDVANYIVQKSLETNKPISNLKLQKILYYLQARYLIETSEPLFNDSIQKWKYGPVVSSVYHEYKVYGSAGIEKVTNVMLVEKDEQDQITNIRFEAYDDKCIEPTDKKTISETVESLSGFGAFKLVELTHSHPMWKEYEREILSSSSDVAPYTWEEIEGFFTKNNEAQIWKNN